MRDSLMAIQGCFSKFDYDCSISLNSLFLFCSSLMIKTLKKDIQTIISSVLLDLETFPKNIA